MEGDGSSDEEDEEDKADEEMTEATRTGVLNRYLFMCDSMEELTDRILVNGGTVREILNLKKRNGTVKRQLEAAKTIILAGGKMVESGEACDSQDVQGRLPQEVLYYYESTKNEWMSKVVMARWARHKLFISAVNRRKRVSWARGQRHTTI